MTVRVHVCRHYKLEAELAEVNWRVRWDAIMFGALEKRKLERSGSRLSLNRVRRHSRKPSVRGRDRPSGWGSIRQRCLSGVGGGTRLGWGRYLSGVGAVSVRGGGGICQGCRRYLSRWGAPRIASYSVSRVYMHKQTLQVRYYLLQ